MNDIFHHRTDERCKLHSQRTAEKRKAAGGSLTEPSPVRTIERGRFQSPYNPDMAGYRIAALPVLVFMSVTIAAPQGRNGVQGQEEQAGLWAAISVFQPIFYGQEVNALQINFGVFNHGSSTVNPKIESTHLFINGVELKEWPFIAWNGLHTSSFYSLPPGQFLEFGKVLGRYFQKPGVYTVRWRSEKFTAPEITFRVVPGNP